MALRLAKAGYGAGNPERILKMKAGMVLKMLQYEVFVNDYEASFIELNKGE